ncbi:MAG: DUF5654 family protein, partial [archaeon]
CFKLSKYARTAKFWLAHTDRLITLITTAFGVVAALFWQTAITDSIKAFIPISGAWTYEVGVAFFVTFIAAAAIFFISRFLKRKKK